MAAEQMVTNENVTQDMLKELFENAYFNVSIDADSDMLIQGRYKYWVEVDDSRRFVRFVSRFKVNERSSLPARIAYANFINQDMIVLRAFALENIVVFDQYIWLEGGVSKKNLVMTLKQFEVLVQAAIQRDKDDVLG